ncbi:reverse transcriptase domain, reverse transcriptase zinc-binding domain protein [Tanacetum coccineum]|uniref:Reverse transcriptase domain, reverse transcriptase zinc-binding domain protein n=1 Tax=Tanacetum coccineum TaxID=301880 RepID=A0ABQ5D711_9ASTR
MTFESDRSDAVVLPSVDEPVAMEVHSPLVEQTNAVKSSGESYPPLPTQGTTPVGNTPVMPVESIRAVSDRFANSTSGFFLGKRVAYPVVANYVRNMWGKFGLVRSMFSSSTGLFSFQFSSMDGLNAMLENVTAFSEDGLSVIATKLGTPIMLDSYTTDTYLQSWGRSSYGRVMIELRADVELKDNIVIAMPKNNGKGFYTCNVRVEYEWKPPRCAYCKIFGHTKVECPKKPDLGARAGETKKKKPSQAPKCILVGPKMTFKPNQEYRPVPEKNTANSSGNKKKGVDSTNKVCDSNPFEVLYSVDNDVEVGTNGGTSNLDKNEDNSSGSSFWNVENSSTGTTPIMDKIKKFANLVIDGQAILVDEAGNPLNIRVRGDTPTPPKPPIDKAYSIASIKACIPTPLDLDKLNYNSWSSLFQRFCKTYEVHHHLAAPSTTATSTVDPLHDTNDSLVVMWIYATISPKLVEMIVDVDSTAHGVWNRLKDLFHDNKDARITQLDNEIRNMAIGNLSITDFFQQLKSKADRLANLESPVLFVRWKLRGTIFRLLLKLNFAFRLDSNYGFGAQLTVIVHIHTASTSGVQEEGISSTPLVAKIHRVEQQLLDGKCVLVDDDGKPLLNRRGLDDNKSLLEQWRGTYGDDEQEYNYEQVRGRSKK